MRYRWVRQVEKEKLEKSLRTRTIKTREGDILKELDPAAAVNSRDSLAKALYARLFEWLVNKINESIGQAGEAPPHSWLLHRSPLY